MINMPTVDADVLYDHLRSKYPRLSISNIEYSGSGLHSNYRVETNVGPLHCRIYRNEWKNEDEISYELNALAYLYNQGATFISRPLETTDGALYSQVESSGISRHVALFTWSEGEAVGSVNCTDKIVSLGLAVVKFHELGMSFLYKNPPTTRQLNFNYLGQESVLAIKPFLNLEQMSIVEDTLKNADLVLARLDRNLSQKSLLSGDINLTNFHIDELGNINLFDFDQCGYGVMIFEIAKFKSSLYRIESSDEVFKAFLTGYCSRRQLTKLELESIDILEKLAIIWVMAIHVWNIDIVGVEKLGSDYWELQVNRLLK
jgi:Ser/Thr protein kinase RdoA (MazF antagonist)